MSAFDKALEKYIEEHYMLNDEGTVRALYYKNNSIYNCPINFNDLEDISKFGRDYEKKRAEVLVEAIVDCFVLHNGESTNTTCCKMEDILERALTIYKGQSDEGT